jgi:hypothetical protein
MRAVRERITIPAARRIERFVDTRLARDRVRHYAGMRATTCARDDPKANGRRRCLVQSVAFDGVNSPKRWTLASQALDKMIERTCVGPCVDQHTFAVVAYITAHAASVRKTPYCWPETHALNQSAHTNDLTDP